ncbi:hypothetical protein HPB47_027065 [Ixodes persulcatus]|uniref:Uncharacterized protein n=1 Tax=Ixodes persulcatus TaxID=34615 RepID=A0AC60PWX3_IXOPE|nr:hypothetical protein HPB47_027065 [Ixodes persulcatus]
MATTQNNQDNCELPTMRRDVPVPESDGLALSLSRPPPHPTPPPPPVVVVATAAVHYLPGTLSPHTQAKTNLRSGATVDARVKKPAGETGGNRPQPDPPAPRAPNDDISQSEEGPYEEEDRLCYLVWAISGVTFITVIIPLGLYVLSMPSTGVRTSQSSTIPGSPTAIPEAQFCATQLRQDTSRTPRPSPADSYSFGTSDEGVQYRDVICVLDIKKLPDVRPKPRLEQLVGSGWDRTMRHRATSAGKALPDQDHRDFVPMVFAHKASAKRSSEARYARATKRIGDRTAVL